MKIKIESLIFASPKPLSLKWLYAFISKNNVKLPREEFDQVVEDLKAKYNVLESGVQIIQSGEDIQMVTNAAASDLVKKFLNEDMTGELTPASLETLTVVAYRGPIAKSELEQIRGVNCSLIIRNLLIRGLIVGDEGAGNGQIYYRVTVDFLKYLGLNAASDLPDYARLHVAENLESILEINEKKYDGDNANGGQ
ncbi:SMC-Scp complex subunit ScpB [Candidatus Falkowbacteria bacterium RIFOXYC2_FULL_48_21]|uniref:SMC-Scp complex subunit ScpB n=1 Tax=Candidatus Falkowbacteria bacterium RIFOXYC2_FULL_48_21 TaxID=1798005 RepID=A0A1F5TGH5_9BACT|nr:MAG: SMC-Scp complex subunit ScpB [Candidatus Falkowbacteria bacterium RIFOXYC2_FULL_48_21]